MASTQQIKRRIRSVKNTKQITKAMELVAASKMRKAQEATLRTRAYRNTAREILTRISELTDVAAHPYYAKSDKINSRLYVVITSNRGLAGAYNSNMLKKFTEVLKRDESEGVASKAIMIGRQGAKFAAKIESLEVVGVYDEFPDEPTANDIRPVLDTCINMFTPNAASTELSDDEADRLAEMASDGESISEQIVRDADEVVVVFTDFVSTINQNATDQVILPAAFEPADSPGDLNDVPFEPSPREVLETITPRLVEVQLLQALLESAASEHVSRMMAMKSASDNASDLVDDLTLIFNSARQSAITQELAEISGGAAAVS